MAHPETDGTSFPASVISSIAVAAHFPQFVSKHVRADLRGLVSFLRCCIPGHRFHPHGSACFTTFFFEGIFIWKSCLYSPIHAFLHRPPERNPGVLASAGKKEAVTCHLSQTRIRKSTCSSYFLYGSQFFFLSFFSIEIRLIRWNMKNIKKKEEQSTPFLKTTIFSWHEYKKKKTNPSETKVYRMHLSSGPLKTDTRVL